MQDLTNYFFQIPSKFPTVGKLHNPEICQSTIEDSLKYC